MRRWLSQCDGRLGADRAARARDLQGRINYVNQAFCRMVGLSAPELLNQSFRRPMATRLASTYHARRNPARRQQPAARRA
jgi:PAS domain S-box-containing protein